MIESLERATRILDLFSSEVPEWTVSEVSRALDFPKTTTWEHIRAMVDLGLLRAVGKSRYRLGWRSFQLGLRARMTSEIAVPARQDMGTLAERFGETLQLATRYAGEVVFLEKVTPKTGVRTSLTRVGRRLPAHCTAGGKVLLAHLSESQLTRALGDGELDKLTPNSLTSRQNLMVEFEGIRERGYAIDLQEVLEGMCCVAAPISNSYGDVVWALSVSFLEYKLEHHAETYARAVMEAAQRLSSPVLPALREQPADKWYES